MITPEEAYKLGYEAYDGDHHFLDNPWIEEDKGYLFILGTNWVNGHYDAIKQSEEI